MKKKKEYTIAVLGTQNAVGQAILAELERQNYPVELIHPLDLHQESGAIISYKSQTLSSSALDLFDLNQPHILFLCEPRIFERYPHHFLHAKNWLIDCTGQIQKAACIIPELNGNNIHCVKHKCLCAPNSSTIALARVLKPLHEKYTLISAQATAILGAWYTQPNLIDPLIQQTRHYFTQTPISQSNTYPSLAFNLIPDFFKNLTPLIQHQLKCFIPTPVQIHTCFAPVLRGGTFFVQVTLERTPHINGIQALFQDKSFCRLITSKQPIGTHDLLAEDKLFIQDIQIHKNTLSFWLIQDPLQTGFIQNAVQILSLLMVK
ncbi:MAG: hypothetical protein II938_04685 [Alphaproteobacteria bacterium]|nr:hypothetical protein [Alphaproteobacteria bacterium]